MSDRAPVLECWRVRVTGRVQGVGFREACIRHATVLGVSGWVRNRTDGSVEAVLQAGADRLEPMREWLQRGPPGARVQDVAVQRLEAPWAGLDGFERRPTE